MNACEVNGAEIKERKHGGENKILAEIREIKSDLASLKNRPTTACLLIEKYQRGSGCNACKKRRVGPSCQHCFACGEFGHNRDL